MDAIKPPQVPNLKPVKRGARKYATARNIFALMLREMSSRYGRTPGGYIWSVLEPLAAIMFLSLGFSLLIRSPSLGTSFILFYATGFMPLHAYLNLSNTVSKSIIFSRPLLRFPAVNWMDAMLARGILNSLTIILVTILLLTIILSTVDHRASLDLTPVIEAFALTILLGFGVGAFNCAVGGLFPIWDVAWSILTRPLFLASGVIFIYDDLPPIAQDYLWYNPLIHITGLARTGFYPTYSPSYISHVYVLFFSLILLAFGLLLTKRYNRDILNR